MTELADWEINDFVAVVYDNQWYPGQITKVNDDETVNVKCMKYVDTYSKSNTSNKFSWPKQVDKKPYVMEELILKLDPPKQLKGGRRHTYFCLSDADYTGACDVFRMLLDTK